MLRPALTPFRGITRRGMHASAVRSSDASQITSDFLARLQMSPNAGRPADSASGSTSGSKSSRHDAARGMINTVGLRDLSGDEGRKPFQAGDFAPPHMYDEANLYDRSRKQSPRYALLGPPKEVAKRIDPFYIRNSNPLDHAMNPLMAVKFTNGMGRIQSRARTGLTWRSQRLVGKMIRRARAMGVISKWNNLPRPGGLGDSESR